MAWSYSGNPASSPLDETRFLIGDTDSNDQLLSNDEINYLLSLNGADPFSTAITAVRGLIAKAAKNSSVTKKVGDLSITAGGGDRVAQWEALLSTLTAEQFRRNGGAALMVTTPSYFQMGAMDNGDD